ncbi:unnamed protein product [Rotaria sp. Silwood1]|nr:unnamed protein product [Rotaria sp. Silwood1]
MAGLQFNEQGQNQGFQYTLSTEGPINSNSTYFTEHQQDLSTTQSSASISKAAFNTPATETLGGVQTTNSFHSISSMDSAVEMSKYFPEPPTPSLLPIRHQQQAEGQAQLASTLNTATSANTNIVNAGSYTPASVPTAVQRLPQPVEGVPSMAQQQQQQQQQRPVQPSGPPQFLSGIPSHPSQIQGLSVSQAVVNDVIVDLQRKVIDETLQQYHGEALSGDYLEPLAPIYLHAPQPTIILRSDLHRLRAELGNRVRPPGNDEYKTTTTGDEHRKEKEERLYNEAQSPALNDDNINDKVHSAFDFQGLSTTSFDRHASPSHSSSLLYNLEEQQQGNEEALLISSNNINSEQLGRTDNMFPRPVHPRQEVTFDIENCILRCFEAHRQRVARRRAARQARKARRLRRSPQQQQYRHLYYTNQYPNFPIQPTTPSFGSVQQTQRQQPLSTSYYSDVVTQPTNIFTSVHTPQTPYIPITTHDYTNVVQTTSLPTDIQQYQTSDIVNTYTNQVPYSSLLTSNIDAGVSTNIQPTTTDYYHFTKQNIQEPYIHSNVFDYTSQQSVPSTTDLIQQSLIEQSQQQRSFEYSSQLPHSTFQSTDAIVPSGIQQLTSEYYQQVPTQHIQTQGTYGQPTTTFEYTTTSTQSQHPLYEYPTVEQTTSQYPYNIETLEQKRSIDYTTTTPATSFPVRTDIQQIQRTQTIDQLSQQPTSSIYHEQQQIPVPISQAQEGYGQPTGTFEYTRESYQLQAPICDSRRAQQQSTQYPYNLETPTTHIQQTEQKQTIDHLSQESTTSTYYEQPPIPQAQGDYGQTTGTLEYTRESYQSQQPIYHYTTGEQQPSRYSYNLDTILQQQPQQQKSFDYTTAATTIYTEPTGDIRQTEQKQTIDHLTQASTSSTYYEQQQIPVLTSQVQGGYGQPTGTFEYTRESYQSEKPIFDSRRAQQQSTQYAYNLERPAADIQQTEQIQTIDHLKQARTSSTYYEQQPISVPIAQAQGGYGQATGTFEYTRDSYQSQQPIYHYTSGEQKTSDYSYNLGISSQQPQQQKSVDYTTAATTTYIQPIGDIRQIEQKQTIDHLGQASVSSQYYEQQQIPVPISRVHEAYGGGTGKFEYIRQDYQSQQPIYDYQSPEQQSSQYSYNLEGTQQQQPTQQEAAQYISKVTKAYLARGTDIQQLQQRQISDRIPIAATSLSYYEQRPIPVPTSQIIDTYTQPTQMLGYRREVHQSQKPIYDYRSAEQPSSQYLYNLEGGVQLGQIQQQDSNKYVSDVATSYVAPGTDIKQIQQQQQIIDHVPIASTSLSYYEQPPIQVSTSQITETYTQPVGTLGCTQQTYETQKPIHDFRRAEQPSSQYLYNLQGGVQLAQSQQQDSDKYVSDVATSYVAPGTDIKQIQQQQQIIDHVPIPRTSVSYYEQRPIQVPISQITETYTQPTGTLGYTKGIYESQKPIYGYQGTDQQSSPYLYNTQGIQQQQPTQPEVTKYISEVARTYLTSGGNIQQTEQQQLIDHVPVVRTSLSYYEQQPIPAPTSKMIETYTQPGGLVEYTKESYQPQKSVYEYQGPDQHLSQYACSLEEGAQVRQAQQEDSYKYASDLTTSHVAPGTDIQQIQQQQIIDHVPIPRTSVSYYEQRPIQVPISQITDTYTQPTGTLGYTKGIYESQKPIYGYLGTDQQSSQYLYNTQGIQQQQPTQPEANKYISEVARAYLTSGGNIQQTEQQQITGHVPVVPTSLGYSEQQPIPAPTSKMIETYTQPGGLVEYTKESYQPQKSVYEYQGPDQHSSQYACSLEEGAQVRQAQQEDSYKYASDLTTSHVAPGTDIQQIQQQQIIDHVPIPRTSVSYYEQRPIQVPISQITDTYTQPTGTLGYTKGIYESQKPIYGYLGTDQQSSQYLYNTQGIQQQQPTQPEATKYISEVARAYLTSGGNIQQTEQQQITGHVPVVPTSLGYSEQQPIPAPTSKMIETYTQPTGLVKYTQESYQPQKPVYEYQDAEKHPAQYGHSLEEGVQVRQAQQDDSYKYLPDAATSYIVPRIDIQQKDQIHTTDDSNQALSSSLQYQEQPVSFPGSRIYDSGLHDQRLTDRLIPSDRIEYAAQSDRSQGPLSDNYSTETFIQQYEQPQKIGSLSVNDYVKQFESKLYPQQSGGPFRSSDDLQSYRMKTNIPFTIQQNVDIHPLQKSKQTYDLQNYTNQSLVSDTLQSSPPISSLLYEEGQPGLLQKTSTRKPVTEIFQKLEPRSDIETSIYDTFSSLPPPPVSEEIDRQQESISTNLSDFPPPPTLDRHAYDITQQRPSRSFRSIIPSTDQTSIYTYQPLLSACIPCGGHGTDVNITGNEEPFNLRRCIFDCYAKYQDLWNKQKQKQKQPQQKQITDLQHPLYDANVINQQEFDQYPQIVPQQPITTVISQNDQQLIPQSNDISFTNYDHQQLPQQYPGKREIHCADVWTQTAPHDLTTQSNILQHTYDQTPAIFDTKPYLSQLPIKDFSTDTRGQQTIEYSPPLITQTRHVIPTIPQSLPLSFYKYTEHKQPQIQPQQQQQQQSIYNHPLPYPPHLSFDDNFYQPNYDFPSQITAQPRHYQNIPLDKYEEQQQRHRGGGGGGSGGLTTIICGGGGGGGLTRMTCGGGGGGGGTYISGNYNEQLRVVDFPVYSSGEDDPNLTPLTAVN